MTPPLVIERPKLRLWSMRPLDILGDAKKAALSAGVSLLFWVEFRATFDACLHPEADPKEMLLAVEVVRERFLTVETEGFKAEVEQLEKAVKATQGAAP